MVGEDFPGVRVPSLVPGDQDGPPAHLAALVPLASGVMIACGMTPRSIAWSVGTTLSATRSLPSRNHDATREIRLNERYFRGRYRAFDDRGHGVRPSFKLT